MRLARWSGAALLLALLGCQAPAPAAPTAAPAVALAPSPSAAPSVAPPPAVSASRVDVLNGANAAYRSGDFVTASGLYERVINTPPGPNEGAAANSVVDFAHFRAMLSLLAHGSEDEAKAHLDALQQRDSSTALARLGLQVWDQYGMTTQLRSACVQVQPQVASQAGGTLLALQGLGVVVDAQSLCSVPQG